jgi:hypothetical protein
LNTSETTVEPRSGLLNVADIIVAPKAAFESLRIVPTWGWAFVITCVLGIAGLLLTIPAQLHAFTQYAPALYAQQFQSMDPAQRAAAVQRAVDYGQIFVKYSWVVIPFVVLLAALVQALIMLIANAVGRGDGTFGRFYAVSMNSAVVGTGVTALLAGLIAVIRGPAAYDTAISVQASVPGLALLAPGAAPKLLTFLTAINVGSVWSIVLLALGMMVAARIPRAVAWTTAVAILLLSALLPAAFAR